MSGGEDLPRGYGLWTGLAVVVASMVGVGILTTSGFTLRDTQSAAALFLLWGLGGLLALAGALTLAELGTAMPRVGGEYVFVREGYGPSTAFLYGWATLLVGFAGPTALISHAAVAYLVAPFEVPDKVVPIGASILIAAVALAHCTGRRGSAALQNASTWFKVLVLLLVAGASLVWGQGSAGHFTSGRALADVDMASVAIGLIYVAYSYSGWNGAVYLAGEMRDPDRLLPRCLVLGTAAVTALYVLLNVVYVYALDPSSMGGRSDSDVLPVAELAARSLFGDRIAGPLSFLFGLGILSSVSAYLFLGPRVSFAMARDGVFPAFAGRVHKATEAPVYGILFQAGLSIALLWTAEFLSGGVGAFENLLNYTGVGLAALLGLTVSSVFAMRRRPGYSPTYCVWAYPLPPLLFLVITGWTVVYSVLSDPVPTGLALGSLLVAYPVYFFLRRP